MPYRPSTSTLPTKLIDALYRKAYRLAYPIWRFYLHRFKVNTQGAQVAVWNDEQVLLIRNSYRETYTFPGGYSRRGEDIARAASRELYEETGILAPVDELKFSFQCLYSSRRHEVRDAIYELHTADRPNLCIDNREVIEARFVNPEAALSLPLENHVRHHLQHRRKQTFED